VAPGKAMAKFVRRRTIDLAGRLWQADLVNLPNRNRKSL
jgi:hypothetical protein